MLWNKLNTGNAMLKSNSYILEIEGIQFKLHPNFSKYKWIYSEIPWDFEEEKEYDEVLTEKWEVLRKLPKEKSNKQ